jgi:hypothetical protein
MPRRIRIACHRAEVQWRSAKPRAGRGYPGNTLPTGGPSSAGADARRLRTSSGRRRERGATKVDRANVHPYGVLMKYFSLWQPLIDEDAHTALVFGFLRHAPSAEALDQWLSNVLERRITAEPPEPDAFWPSYVSVMDGHHRTEPELVLDAVDERGRLIVIIEAKPGFAQHTKAQVTREIIDAASSESSERVCADHDRRRSVSAAGRGQVVGGDPPGSGLPRPRGPSGRTALLVLGSAGRGDHRVRQASPGLELLRQ